MGKGTINISRELKEDTRFMDELESFFDSMELAEENHFSFFYIVEHPNIFEYRNYEIIGHRLGDNEFTFVLI